MSASPIDFAAVAGATFERTDAMFVLVDGEQRVVAINAAAASVTGIDPAVAEGVDATALVAARHAPEFRRAMREAVYGRSCTQETAPPDAATGHHSLAWSISRVQEEPCLIACVGIDVTATRDECEDLRLRAITDQLTGLPNRAGLVEHLAKVAGTGASVVFCDLNNFKAVNDSLGHAAGDVVLVQAARRLKRAVRGEDFVARLGGDEFVIVVPPDANASFDGLARRLLRAIEQPMVLPGGVAATVGMSVGYSVLSPGVDPVSALFAADQEMYKMKSRLPTRTTADVTHT